MQNEISGFKSTLQQGLLFDEPLRGHGHVRNVIGNLAEELTVQLTGGQRHKTDSRAKYCPDVSKEGAFFESKAAGRTRQTFIYEGRLIKDSKFSREHKLCYVIWHHLAETKRARTVEELRGLVLANMQCVYLVPFEAIMSICQIMTPEPLNSAYGGTDRRTYGSGYRISLKLLESFVACHYGGSGYVLNCSDAKIPKETQETGI